MPSEQTDPLFNHFQKNVNRPVSATSTETLARDLRAAGKRAAPETRIELASHLAHAAFLAPDQVAEVYDALSAGWTGSAVNAKPISTLGTAPEQAPDGLWAAWYAVVEDALAGELDALAITERTAALGGMMPERFTARVAEMSYLYPGIRQAAGSELPDHVTLGTLAACPAGSLGRQFHDLIVDNTFDLEVLDRDELGLSDLPAPLDYLNTRILQAHDLWHIAAGYETTALHEIAISAFQMAQFGHNYSAQFLSVTAAVGAKAPARGFGVLMDTVTSAWVHGRETSPMMLIDWETEWHRPVDDIRQTFGIAPYKRPYPANLIERAQSAEAFFARIRSWVGAMLGRPRTARA